MIEFKKGDIILCKKDYEFQFAGSPQWGVYKNQLYTIRYSGWWDSPENSVIVFGVDGLTFYKLLNGKHSAVFANAPQFYEHFHSKKEMRKLKILKLK